MKRLSALLISIFISQMLMAQINEAIKFKITSPLGGTDETIIRLSEEASSPFDPMWDAWKGFTFNDNIPSLFSETSNAEPLAINAVNYMEKDTVIELMLRTRIVAGTYTMETFQQGSFPDNIKVAIKDKETGMVYELDQDQTFTFNVQASSADYPRFEVFYSPKAEYLVDQNNLTIVDQGCQDWSFEIYNSTQNQVVAGVGMADSIQVFNLDNDNYTLYVSDAYNLVDTLNFIIEYQDTTVTVETDTTDSTSTTTENTVSSIEESLVLNEKIISTETGYYLDLSNSNLKNDVLISTYTINGQLINVTNHINQMQGVDIVLPENGIYLVVLTLSTQEQKVYKLPFFK